MRRAGILLLLLMAVISTGAAFRFHQLSREQADLLVQSARQLEELKHVLGSSRVPEPDWTEIGKALKSDDPLEKLRSDLLARNDLIPWEGVLGGRMAIPGPDSIWFFAPNWALAYVEDGHIAGYLLFRFRIRGEKIEWVPVDAETL
jgi:hypothetical protein